MKYFTSLLIFFSIQAAWCDVSQGDTVQFNRNLILNYDKTNSKGVSSKIFFIDKMSELSNLYPKGFCEITLSGEAKTSYMINATHKLTLHPTNKGVALMDYSKSKTKPVGSIQCGNGINGPYFKSDSSDFETLLKATLGAEIIRKRAPKNSQKSTLQVPEQKDQTGATP